MLDRDVMATFEEQAERHKKMNNIIPLDKANPGDFVKFSIEDEEHNLCAPYAVGMLIARKQYEQTGKILLDILFYNLNDDSALALDVDQETGICTKTKSDFDHTTDDEFLELLGEEGYEVFDNEMANINIGLHFPGTATVSII